jgi:metal-responsive CopG/Arc/MetJ family transcriptional regulator
MKTAVSIPDSIFETADQLAKELGISRSELYARALEELIRNRKREHITASINATLASLEPESETGQAFLDRATRDSFARNGW